MPAVYYAYFAAELEFFELRNCSAAALLDCLRPAVLGFGLPETAHVRFRSLIVRMEANCIFTETQRKHLRREMVAQLNQRWPAGKFRSIKLDRH
jgi:hypothetical protein